MQQKSGTLTLVVSCIDPNKNDILRREEQTVEISLPPVGGEATVLSFAVVVRPGIFIILSTELYYLQGKQGKERVMERPEHHVTVVQDGTAGHESAYRKEMIECSSSNCLSSRA